MLKKEEKAYDQKRNKLYYLKESIKVFVQYIIVLFFKLTEFGISNGKRVKIEIMVTFHNQLFIIDEIVLYCLHKSLKSGKRM